MPDGSIRLVWKNGEDEFCLAMAGQIFALQDACHKTGIAEIMNRLRQGRWFFEDVRETIRLALVGGGKTDERAMELIKLHVDPPNKLAEHALLAYRILAHALVGVEDDEVGKKKPAEQPAKGRRSSTRKGT